MINRTTIEKSEPVTGVASSIWSEMEDSIFIKTLTKQEKVKLCSIIA